VGCVLTEAGGNPTLTNSACSSLSPPVYSPPKKARYALANAGSNSAASKRATFAPVVSALAELVPPPRGLAAFARALSRFLSLRFCNIRTGATITISSGPAEIVLVLVARVAFTPGIKVLISLLPATLAAVTPDVAGPDLAALGVAAPELGAETPLAATAAAGAPAAPDPVAGALAVPALAAGAFAAGLLRSPALRCMTAWPFSGSP
jgi:hypothetical protein